MKGRRETRSPRRSGNDREDYYYVGGERIEVKRRPDLVAVVYDSRLPATRIESARGIRSAGLTPADEFPEMQRGNVRLYHVGDRAANRVRALMDELQPEEGVEKVGAVYVNEREQPLVLTDELVVKFKPDLTSDRIEQIKRDMGLETVMTLPFSENAYEMRVKPDAGRNALQIANELVEQGPAEYAYPNWQEVIGVRGTTVMEPAIEVRHGVHPTDPLFPQQWHHENTGQVVGGVPGTPGADIRTTLAWQTTTGNPNVRLAVIDVGVDIAHPDLNAPGKLVAPIDFTVTPPDANPLGAAHGTEVAGMAVATDNNACAGAGSAPDCRLIPIRAPDVGPQLQMALGFAYAADQGADVITCSLGPVGPWTMTDALREAIDYATTYGRNGRGCVYTQAVDNSTNPVSIDQVSAYERSVAVSRTNNRDLYDGTATSLPATPNQNTGPAMGVELDLCAPGASVVTITNTGATACTNATRSGTSYATPLTAGVACLVLSVNQNLSWEEVRQVLLDSADKIDAAAFPYAPAPANRPPGTRNDRYGYGRVNAERAVQLARAGSTRDLYIRDTPSDNGNVPQPAYGFWDSPDIFVRNLDDNGTTHQDTIRGRDNFIYARISNRGSSASLPCWVRFYISTFAGTEFRYPFDFKRDTTSAPGGGTPGNLRPRSQFPAPATYLVGEYRIASIPAGGNAVAKVRWETSLIPPATGWHPCLLVEISPHDGPTVTGVHTWENNNLGQKNITIINARRGQRLDLPFRFGHPTLKDQFVTLNIQKVNASTDWALFLDLREPKLLQAVAAAAGVALPSAGAGPAVLPTAALEPLSQPLSPMFSAASTLAGGGPFKLTFLEEARIAISTTQNRAHDGALVFTFPQASTVEIGRFPTLLPGGAFGTISSSIGAGLGTGAATPSRPAFSVQALEGIEVLALDPAQKLAKVDIPVAEVPAKESVLGLRVPQSAIPGESVVFDIAQSDPRGQIVGGVRVQVNVIE